MTANLDDPLGKKPGNNMDNQLGGNFQPGFNYDLPAPTPDPPPKITPIAPSIEDILPFMRRPQSRPPSIPLPSGKPDGWFHQYYDPPPSLPPRAPTPFDLAPLPMFPFANDYASAGRGSSGAFRLTPVDYDPFGGAQFVPVDHDPFEDQEVILSKA